jgi:hypothetical protein
MATGGSLMVALIAAGVLADTQQGRAFIRETGAHAAVKALPGRAGRLAGRVASAGSARGAGTARAAGQRTQRAARAAGGKTEAKAAARWDARQAAGGPMPVVSRVRPAADSPDTGVVVDGVTAVHDEPSGGVPVGASTKGSSQPPQVVSRDDPVIAHGSQNRAVRQSAQESPSVTSHDGSSAASGGTTSKEQDMPEMYFDFSDAPESDADHLDRLKDLARGLNTISEGIAQYEETLANAGLDSKSYAGLAAAAEAAAESASALSSAARKFTSTYQGVIETVANGTKLPDGKFFTGEAA